MNALGRLWRGDLPLAQAFWNWAVIGGLTLNLSAIALFMALILNGYVITAFVVAYIPPVFFNFVVTVGVWRSAAHYRGERHWATLARIVTVAGMVVLSIL